MSEDPKNWWKTLRAQWNSRPPVYIACARPPQSAGGFWQNTQTVAALSPIHGITGGKNISAQTSRPRCVRKAATEIEWTRAHHTPPGRNIRKGMRDFSLSCVPLRANLLWQSSRFISAPNVWPILYIICSRRRPDLQCKGIKWVIWWKDRHWGVKLQERAGGQARQERSRWLKISTIKILQCQQNWTINYSNLKYFIVHEFVFNNSQAESFQYLYWSLALSYRQNKNCSTQKFSAIAPFHPYQLAVLGAVGLRGWGPQTTRGHVMIYYW